MSELSFLVTCEWNRIEKYNIVMEWTVLIVEEMMCETSCVPTVITALKGLPGVKQAELISLASKLIKIQHDKTVAISQLINAVEGIGFGAKDILTRKPTIVLNVEGMMCQKNCGSTVANALRNNNNVLWAISIFESKVAHVWLAQDESATSTLIQQLIGSIEAVGFDSSLKELSDASAAPSSVLTPCDLSIKLAAKTFKNTTSEKVVNSIIHLMESVDGVVKAAVNLKDCTLSIWGFADYDSIVTILRTNGYVVEDKVKPTSTRDEPKTDKYGSLASSSSDSNNRYTGREILELKISGMSCASCVRAIESSLMKLSSIKSVKVALLAEKGEIVFDALNIEPEEIIASIKTIGYDCSILSLSKQGNSSKELMFTVSGMSCANCASKIERTVSKLPGVISASVSCTLNKACVAINEDADNAVGPRDIIDTVDSIGYHATLVNADTSNRASDGYEEIRHWGRLLIVALVFGIPIMFLHLSMGSIPFVEMLFMDPGMCGGSVSVGQTMIFFMSLPMQFGVGYKFYRAAIFGAINGNFGMDFLVVTGTSITYMYSLVQLYYTCTTHIMTMHMFFEASSMLLMFVTLGKYIEAYAKGKTQSALTELMQMQPKKATLVGKTPDRSGSTKPFLESSDWITNEILTEIDVDLVQKGDTLKVLPGSQIPTDGFIIHGETYIDESMITGESVPVRRVKGDMLYGSTINQSSVVYLTVSSVGKESALAQIINLVEKAQMNKAPVQAYADYIAGLFTPLVLFIATVTFTIWSLLAYYHRIPREWFEEEYGDPFLFAMLFAISVIVISCPCALGLATPTAIMVGTTVGAHNGILIKGGPSFEAAYTINTVIFDKTGTLTEGKPSVTDVVVYSKPSGDDSSALQDYVLQLAASAEQGSEHPLALAVTTAANKKKMTLLPVQKGSFQSIPGSGLSCVVPDGTVLIGNRSLLEKNNIVISQELDSTMWDLEIQGKTAITVSLNYKVLGVIGIADVVKPDAYDALCALKQLGIDIWMVTGDNRTTAESIGDELGISKDRIVAGVMPVDKVTKVEELQATGKFVAMVGDGVNDSPALARANLGIAVGAGTHVALEAADMILVRNKLDDVVVAFDLARVVFNRIKINFIWALAYNILAIPFAAGVWFPWTHMLIPPQYAGMLMAFSSISVVVSSLLLKFYKRPQMDRYPAKATYSESMIRTTTKTFQDIGKSITKGKQAVTAYSPLHTEDELGIELGIGSYRREYSSVHSNVDNVI